MQRRSDSLVKWIAYAVLTALLLFLHTLLLRGLILWGVTPFLPPIIVAVLSTQEDRHSTMVFSLILGFFCDLTVAAPFMGLYTVALPLAALVCAHCSARVVRAGFFGALPVAAVAFGVIDVFLFVYFLCTGEAFFPLLYNGLREMLISLPQILICYPLFAFVHSRVTV